MRLPRFRLAWLMVFVAFAALDFGAMRALRSFMPITHTGETLLVGALPMANVLVVGLLIGRWRDGSRRFLWGFEVFGALALALYIAMAILFTGGLLQSYLDLAIKPIGEAIRGRLLTFRMMIALYSILAIWASLPQLAFALIGGVLWHKFKTAERPG